MEDNTPLPIPNSFAEERKEYERTIEDMFNTLAESQHERKAAMDELLRKLAEYEEDRRTANDGRMYAEERWRLAEQDLGASIEKEKTFEGLYYDEWEKRKSVEEELASCKEELKETKKENNGYHKLKNKRD